MHTHVRMHCDSSPCPRTRTSGGLPTAYYLPAKQVLGGVRAERVGSQQVPSLQQPELGCRDDDVGVALHGADGAWGGRQAGGGSSPNGSRYHSYLHGYVCMGVLVYATCSPTLNASAHQVDLQPCPPSGMRPQPYMYGSPQASPQMTASGTRAHTQHTCLRPPSSSCQ